MIMLMMMMMMMQVESAGRDHSGPVSRRHHPRGDRVWLHSNQPDNNPRDESYENCARSVQFTAATCRCYVGFTYFSCVIYCRIEVFVNHLPFSGQHLSNDEYLEDEKFIRGRFSDMFFDVLCTTMVYGDRHTYISSFDS